MEWIVGFEVLIAVVMNVAIFWDIAPCNPYMNHRFVGTYHFHLQGRKSTEKEASVKHVARHVWMEVMLSSETSLYTWTTRPYIPEDGNINRMG
jgi:hypothetical protein